MNNFNLLGRLVREPEIANTKSGKVYARFSIAVRKDKDTADYFNLVSFGKTAELCDYITKGDLILVSGSIHNNNYKGKDDEMKYTNDFIVSNLYFCTSKKEKETEKKPKKSKKEVYYRDIPDEDEDDADLPFN